MGWQSKIILSVLMVVPLVVRADEAGLYREGVAAFKAGDYAAAGRALGQLAPFTHAEFGEQARYLLARVHQLCGERPEAQALYEGIIRFYIDNKKAAAESLRRPELLKDKPQEEARLTALAKGPAPRYVVRSWFHLGRLLAEEGRFDEALGKFVASAQQADGALKDEALLWMGVCQVRLTRTTNFSSAIRTLTPLMHDAEALRWLARAHGGSGQMRTAIELMTKAAESTPVYRMELADMLRRDRQYAGAAKIYGSIEGEKARYRQAVALSLGGQFKEADEALLKFQQDYPGSSLVADAAVRYAESALLARDFDEAGRRFTAVIQRYPQTTQGYLAKLGLAQVRYQRGNFDEAAKIAAEIPDTERSGDVATASYLIGDCMLRKLPADAGEDALAAARLMEQLKEVGDQFRGFMLSCPDDPQTVDAMLKFGYCQQRIAGLILDPLERRQALGMTPRMYMALARQFPDHPLHPILVLEMARCTSQMGARLGEAELARFQSEPLKSSAVAPLGLIRLGEAMRRMRRAGEAAALLAQVRVDYEEQLAKDPAKAAWAAGLRFSLGMALKEGGKYTEAAEVLASVARDYPSSAQVAEIPWRLAQCKRDLAMDQVMSNRKRMSGRSARPTGDGGAAAMAAIQGALDQLRDAAKLMAGEANAKKDSSPELAGQIAYDSAWCWRTVGESELDLARLAAQEELMQKQRLRKQARLPATRPAQVETSAIPIQPGEKEARAAYQAVLEIAPESAIALEARSELADLYVQRDEHERVIKLLEPVIDSVRQPEMSDRLRLRLGYSYLAKSDARAALPLFEAIGQTQRSAYTAQARLAMLRAKDILAGAADKNQAIAAPRGLVTGRKRSNGAIDLGQVWLPPVLNLDGTGEFAKLAPMARLTSSDLADEETGMLDEMLTSRSIPEDESILR